MVDVCPKNAATVPCMRSSDRWLFDRLDSGPLEETGGPWTVGLHTYDLTQGFMTAHPHVMAALLADPLASHAPDTAAAPTDPIEALHHSGLVVFGLELYFEGGVAIAAKGCTRFGATYAYHPLGVTNKTCRALMEWLRIAELEQFQMAHYTPTTHNCHRFTLEACRFLLDQTDQYPTFVLRNLESVCSTPIGKLVAPLMTRFTGGVQHVVLDQLLHHDAQRDMAFRVIERVCTLAAVPEHCAPPRSVVLFALPAHQAANAIRGLRALGVPEEGARLQYSDCAVIERVAACFEASHAVAEFDVDRMVTLLDALCTALPLFAWAPILNAWRCLALDKRVLTGLVFSPALGSLLLQGCTLFYDMPESVQLALLRTLCNYASAPHGATTLCDPRRLHMYTTLVGMALTMPDIHSPVAELGAALLLNIGTSMVVLTKTSLDRELKHHGESHAAYRLLTVILGLLFTPGSVTEANMHLMLLTLFHLTSSSADLTAYMIEHPLYEGACFASLLAVVKSEQCRRLLQMLGTIEELCMNCDSNDASSEDVEEAVEDLVASMCAASHTS